MRRTARTNAPHARALISRLQGRAAGVPGLEAEPGEVLFAGVFRPVEQLKPPDDHDFAAGGQEGNSRDRSRRRASLAVKP